MIVMIQCAASKRPDAGSFRASDGRRVVFAANPGLAPAGPNAYAHPDENSGDGRSWREVLTEYNSEPSVNPFGLLKAIYLYENPAYRRLAERFGLERLFILSAGWGLIRSDFLTPSYDITFSQSARKQPYKLRHPKDRYDDYRRLKDADEPIVFFGGRDYVPLFTKLTDDARVERTVFFNSQTRPDAPGCTSKRYETTTRTNWHYECANAFLANPAKLMGRYVEWLSSARNVPSRAAPASLSVYRPPRHGSQAIPSLSASSWLL